MVALYVNVDPVISAKRVLYAANTVFEAANKVIKGLEKKYIRSSYS